MNIKRWILLVIFPLCAYSAYINAYLAHHTLSNDAMFRVKPGLDFLNHQDREVLVVQNQYIAQEFASLFETKKIFLTEDQRSFDQLRMLLKARAVTKIIYISHEADLKMSLGNLLNGNNELKKIGDYYFAAYDLK